MSISVIKWANFRRFSVLGRHLTKSSKWDWSQQKRSFHQQQIIGGIRSADPYSVIVKRYAAVNPCSFCGFHTSTTVCKKKMKIVKKPIFYSPKSKKKPETIIDVWRNMTVGELATALQKDIDHVFEVMLFVENSDQYDTPSAIIDNVAVIVNIVQKSGVRCTFISNPHEELKIRANKDAVRRPPPEDSRSLVKRPPVVTVMGHVDHGKTTLLDSLRNTSVVSQEFGGITQHIGAFNVCLSSGETVTFLDTPGHAAFMAMRARGAHVTDIVVLVVAADDGVMEQTIECIRLANEVKVPIIVAINKMDKPQVDIDLCKRGLLQHGLQLEEAGGDIQSVPISALEGTNLNVLMETITTQAEMMHLQADPKGFVEGYVVESKTDQHRGKLSTSIIKRGTLRKGAFLVAGTAWAKVRAMFDDKGQPVQEAPPSTPVEIVGWRELPSAGDELLEVDSEKRAREVIAHRLQLEKDKKMEGDSIIVRKKAEDHLKVYKDALAKRRAEGLYRPRRPAIREKESKDEYTGPRLEIVLKGDVDGSVEAILDVLDTYHSPKCQLNVINYGVGMVSENDIELCTAFKGVTYSFNTGIHPTAKQLAKELNIPIKEFNVIYKLIDDVREEINRRLPKVEKDEILGEADVLQEFFINEGRHKIPVAGSRCVKGTLKKSALFRIIRGEEIVYENAKLSSMRHLKSEVESIKKDVECGLKFDNHEMKFQPGDRIICYQKIMVSTTIDWDPGF